MKSNEILAKYTVHEYLCVCFVYKITLGLKKKDDTHSLFSLEVWWELVNEIDSRKNAFQCKEV